MVDVYEVVTDRILAALDAGTVPWRKPWRASGPEGWPRNIEGRRYRGINVFLTALAGYESPYWMTFRQALERGGSVRKGEKGTLITFWKQLQITVEEDGQRVQKRVPMLRYFTVFNLAQTDGVKLPKGAVEPAPTVAPDPVAAAEAIIAAYPNGPGVIWGTPGRAYYVPGLDNVHLPARTDFPTSAGLYETVFHELGHSTGHPTRLDREGISGFSHFGSQLYGREELVAEMTAAFLCAEAGIEPGEVEGNLAAYLANWVSAIKADKKAVVVAAGKAQKAADHILGRVVEIEQAVAA